MTKPPPIAYNMEIRADSSLPLSPMEIRVEKSKLITNYTSNINTDTNVNGQRLAAVTSFKYLGSVITEKSSKSEILSRITQKTAILTRLKKPV